MEWIVIYCFIYAWAYFKAEGISFHSEGSLDGGNVTECQKIVRLNCQADDANTLTFRLNETEIAYCFRTCQETPPIPERYTIIHDYNARLISLQINSTSVIDEQYIFKCEADGQNRKINPIIKVFPKNETTRMTNVSDTSGSIENITVRTGCTRDMSTVYFDWKKTKNKDGTNLEQLNKGEYEYTNPTTDNTCCDLSKNCGFGLSNTIKLHVNTGGSVSYYIHCTIFTKDPLAPGNVTIISDTPFFIRDESTSTTDTATVTPNNLSSQTTSYPVTKPSSSEKMTTITATNSHENTTIVPTTGMTVVHDENGGLSIGAIVGIVVGAIAVVGTVVIIVLKLFVFKKTEQIRNTIPRSDQQNHVISDALHH